MTARSRSRADQKSRVETRNATGDVHPRSDPRIATVLKNVMSSRAARDRENYNPRGIARALLDSYSAEQHAQCGRFGLARGAPSYARDGNGARSSLFRLSHVLGHAMAMRGDDQRSLPLCDLCVLDAAANEGPTRARMLIAVMDHGKVHVCARATMGARAQTLIIHQP
jgi:hypothetical protein